ncbi:MAG: DUF3108 domain-containing protein [Dysgonomonas sp.]
MTQPINRFIALLSIILLAGSTIQAQCTYTNNTFQGGETLQYDLYFKYGLVYTKAGSGYLQTTDSKYSGKEAYKMDLITASSGALRKLFELNDTLSCYMSKQLTPLAYFKNAHEGGDYTKEKLYYSYANSKVNISTTRHKNGDKKFSDNLTVDQCTYDFLSVVFFARALNYSGMKVNSRTRISFISGRDRQNMDILYEGTENIKANDSKTYKCYKLSLITSDNAFQNQKEAMKIYITADENKVPVRMDTSLKIGSMRVMLRSSKGLRN